MDYKVGDYKWDQLSMWDFPPKDCVHMYVQSNCGKHVFHFVLKRVYEIVSDRQLKQEVVTSIEGVPKDTLNYREGELYIRADGKNTKVDKESL